MMIMKKKLSGCGDSSRYDKISDNDTTVIGTGTISFHSVTMAPGWAVATQGINSKVDVCEKAKHHTELFW